MLKAPIVEIFPTIQGEGPGLGIPSLFVRFGGCNLRCQFKGEACDTPYAVFTPEALTKKNPALKFGYDQWYPHTVKDLVKKILIQDIKHLVFSGGEPTMYQDFLIEVMETLNSESLQKIKQESYTAEIETNGTIIIKPELRSNYAFTHFNISVKLKSSNQEPGYDEKRINPEALRSFPTDRSAYKFVITNPEEDIKEIKEILQVREIAAGIPVYVMPEGMTREVIIENSQAVVDLAIENGFRFSPREHIIIWDTKKGK